MDHPPKVCLNMIVKNESRIITRLLSSVAPLLDGYCICDTGSTDNTIEIIETFFRERNIPGKVIQEPFRDFGYNRTYALQACESMTDMDYVLLLDADMIFWKNPSVTPAQWKQQLKRSDLFYIYQGTESFYYKNARIVKNNHGFTYWGVTHEYVNSPPNTKTCQIDKAVCFIKDIGDGGSKQNKFLRDVALLKKGLEENPDNDRYTFYLANSLKDSGQKKEAIETYQKRIAIGGWIEEVWYSYYNMGKCYQEMGNMDGAIRAWLDGYEAYPQRIENLYELVQYYRTQGKNKLAQKLYEMARENRDTYLERDYLFMQKDIYDYKLDYEMSIVGFYCNPLKLDLIQLNMRLLSQHDHMENGIGKNILSNYKFYCPCIQSCDTGTWKELQTVLESIGQTIASLNPSSHFKPSTPTFCMHPSKPNVVCVIRRFVNYYINDQGNYENQEYIETQNVWAELQYNSDSSPKWTIAREELLKYTTTYDNKYVGLEDVRILSHNNQIYYNANRGLNVNQMVVEHGRINVSDIHTEDSVHLSISNPRPIEKNWVMFSSTDSDPNPNTSLQMVYQWHPLTIGHIDENTHVFHVDETLKTPYFFQFLRGSTNGVWIDNEVWFLCHLVSYEDRRVYYHVIVMIDKDTRKIRYTRLFTFARSPVEYSLGMIYKNDELWIGYSILDRSTHYLSVKKSEVESWVVI